VDGSSNDNTVDILNKYPHINWVSERDKGQSDAMNKAFAHSAGDVIIYLNADDELDSNALMNFKQAFDAGPGYDMVVANLQVNNCGAKNIAQPSVNLRQILNYWPCIFPANPVSYAYKRSLQITVGNFPVNNHYSMDYWFLLRAILKGKVEKKDFTAGTFYLDGLNKSADPGNSEHWLRLVRNQFLTRYFYYPDVFKYIVRKFIPA